MPDEPDFPMTALPDASIPPEPQTLGAQRADAIATSFARRA